MSRTSKNAAFCTKAYRRTLLPEQKQALVLDCTSELISFHNLQHEIVWANRAAGESSGLSAERIVGRRCYEVWQHRTTPCPHCPVHEALETGEHRQCEVTTPDGRVWHMSVYPIQDAHGIVTGAIEVKRNITEQKHAQQTLARIDRALTVLSTSNSVLVRAVDEQTLLKEICQILVHAGGYALAYVAYTACGPHQRLIPVCHAGNGQEYLTFLERELVHIDDTFLPRIALAQRKPCLAKNLRAVAPRCAWARVAVGHGFASAVALPLLNNGSAFGALCLYAMTDDVFTKHELTMLQELADDLVYGITTLRTRIEHQRSELRVQHSLARLQNALEETVQALSSVVEKRDCYTAGHQRRVTKLACAIADKMGMPAEQIQGVRLAGLLHDIGKITIPSEILTKPATLSRAEAAIVRTHPQVGYDIVKAIEFPWPVAQIVRQHHERMDTSGYPQGLGSNQILLEARIMAVADVIEAMSSHRPYRPAYKMDRAMQEITHNRERLYDPRVVDACLQLLCEDKFQVNSLF